jgi:hypothetical protein
VDPPSQTEIQRSPDARKLAERALVRLLHALRGEDAGIIVLGGLVPEMLTRGQEPPAPTHLGTTDVDVLLLAQTMPGADLSHLEKCLRDVDFAPQPEGWRWRGRVEGSIVKIEFLCDRDTAPEHEVVPVLGCTELTAMNLRGTGYVARDWTWVALRSNLGGREVLVKARFAKLGGYLLSKCVAARTRGATKDFYDLAYVLLHNRAGGPSEAAGVLADGKLRAAVPVLRSTLLEIAERYRTPNAVGPSGYAEQALLAAPESDEAELRADAVAAVAEFLEALDAATGFRARTG